MSPQRSTWSAADFRRLPRPKPGGKTRRGLFPAVAAACLCLALSANRSGAWETFHGDPGLTGAVDTEFPAAPTILWRSAVPGVVSSPCLVDRSHVYAFTDSGEIVALDSRSGERRWSVSSRRLAAGADDSQPAPSWSGSGVLVGEGIAAGTSDGKIYLIRRTDGAKVWERDLGKGLHTDLGKARAEGGELVLAVSRGDGVMVALDAASGREVWRSAGVGRSDCPPSAGPGVAVYGSCASAIHILALADGREMRAATLGDDCQVAAGTAVAGTIAFAGNRAGSMTAVNLPDGRILWHENISAGGIFRTPAVNAKRVVASDDAGVVFCLDAGTGKPLWSRQLALDPTAPVITRNQVLTTDDGAVYGLAADSGEVVWRKPLSDSVSPAAVLGGVLFVGTDEREVVAIGGGAADGKIRTETE